MEFDLDDDQEALQRVVREVLEAECPTTLVRSVVEDRVDAGAVDALWKSYVGLDWPMLAVPEADGGVGATELELALLHEELGRVADPTPLLATTSQYIPLVRACGSDEQVGELIGEVGGGTVGAASFEPGLSAVRSGDGWLVDGTARLVLDGDRATRLAVVADTDGDPAVFVVDASLVAVTRTPAFDDTVHLADVQCDGVRVPDSARLAGPPSGDGIRTARSAALIGLAAGTVGASQRILDLALDHVRSRHQFDQPIGAFQAVKHMLVDVYVAIERARALVHFAARAVADGDERRHLAASMAKAASGDCQRIAVRHGIQLFGGLGYTWENDLHLFVRRAQLGEVLLGSSASHRASIAADPTGRDEHGLAPMGPEADEQTERFRLELAAWLDENAPDPATTTERPLSSADLPGWARDWQRKMFDAGWLVPGNPPEFGGRDADLMQQFAYLEELGRREIYNTFNPQGLSIIVPSILAFGTDEQRRRWALPILRGEITAALGMSEPDAGSDLAGLRTRAVLDGDHFVVNGQKVWTSGAHDADVILAFVRTDPDAPKHQGISVLLVPTDVEGLTRRPFGSVVSSEDLDFNEVFFDDVVVPAENLVGPLHEGWRVATGSLGHERSMLWLTFAERLDHLIAHGPGALRDAGTFDDPHTQEWFGDAVTDAYALRLLGYQGLVRASRGEIGPEQSILKLFGSEAVQRGALGMVESLGPAALDTTRLSAPLSPLRTEHLSASWFDLYLRSFSGTIAGGTSQIQRNIIAERVLGLPR